jgi:mannosyl-3-phosphoglycerate phosphatase
MAYIVFTDLDGTLLDAETYSPEAALPALDRLARLRVPIVLTTSKTRAEVEFWRAKLRNSDPFIVENGGAIFIPQGYFPFPVPSSKHRSDYEVLELGIPHSELVTTLREASASCGIRIMGFEDMTVMAVSALSGLPLKQAELAKHREYDEPFQILDSTVEPLLCEIEKRGRRWTRGGRFFHVTGNNDKGEAIRRLTTLYKRVYPSVLTIGLGDGLNDIPLLLNVDVPTLIRSPQLDDVQRRVPHGRVTRLPGPAGWAEAILEMIPE